MGKVSGNGQRQLLKKVLVNYSYVGLWITLSFIVIVFNKYILDKDMYNWPYPLSLTMIHMGFSSVMAFIVVRVLRLQEPIGMPKKLYLSTIVPIGFLYAMSLWFSNSAYMFLSVSLIQMLKAFMPVSVYTISVIFGKEGFNRRTMGNMLGITVGVIVAAYGEVKLNFSGVTLQLAAVVFESTRLVFIQILLSSRGISLNPITTLYYVAPCCFAFLSIPWYFIEYPSLIASSSSLRPDFLLFGANSACAFALNLAVFLLIGKTSALSMNIAGIVKDWCLIAFSWSVIQDQVTSINLVGYLLAFLGVCFYNHSKLQALKAIETQKKIAADAGDEESRHHLLDLKKDDTHMNGKKTVSQP